MKIVKVSRYQYRQFWVEIATEVVYENDSSDISYAGHVRLGDIAGVVTTERTTTPEAAEYLAEKVVDEIHQTMTKNAKIELTNTEPYGKLKESRH